MACGWTGVDAKPRRMERMTGQRKHGKLTKIHENPSFGRLSAALRYWDEKTLEDLGIRTDHLQSALRTFAAKASRAISSCVLLAVRGILHRAGLLRVRLYHIHAGLA